MKKSARRALDEEKHVTFSVHDLADALASEIKKCDLELCLQSLCDSNPDLCKHMTREMKKEAKRCLAWCRDCTH
jgi:hypothetical protein